jgi:hypothetical protein
MQENTSNVKKHAFVSATKRLSSSFSRHKRILILLCTVLILIWALLPAIRAVTLILNQSGRLAPQAALADIPVQEVQFHATDGVHLAGWLAIADAHAPTIILVHGFKGSRSDMLPKARRSRIWGTSRDHLLRYLFCLTSQHSSTCLSERTWQTAVHSPLLRRSLPVPFSSFMRLTIRIPPPLLRASINCMQLPVNPNSNGSRPVEGMWVPLERIRQSMNNAFWRSLSSTYKSVCINFILFANQSV